MIQLLKTISRELQVWLDFIIRHLPGSVGRIVREFMFKKRAKGAGIKINIGIGVEITGYENIEFGNNITIMNYSSIRADNAQIIFGHNISINSNSCIDAAQGGQVVIGNDCLIAQNVIIRASDHKFEDIEVPINSQGHTGGSIVLGNDCWIGANAVITRNVCIGSHSIVAAGAVVTKNIEPFSIVAGVPAKLIRKRGGI